MLELLKSRNPWIWNQRFLLGVYSLYEEKYFLEINNLYVFLKKELLKTAI